MKKLFTLLNCFFVCSLLFGQTTQKKTIDCATYVSFVHGTNGPGGWVNYYLVPHLIKANVIEDELGNMQINSAQVNVERTFSVRSKDHTISNKLVCTISNGNLTGTFSFSGIYHEDAIVPQAPRTNAERIMEKYLKTEPEPEHNDKIILTYNFKDGKRVGLQKEYFQKQTGEDQKITCEYVISDSLITSYKESSEREGGLKTSIEMVADSKGNIIKYIYKNRGSDDINIRVKGIYAYNYIDQNSSLEYENIISKLINGEYNEANLKELGYFFTEPGIDYALDCSSAIDEIAFTKITDLNDNEIYFPKNRFTTIKLNESNFHVFPPKVLIQKVPLNYMSESLYNTTTNNGTDFSKLLIDERVDKHYIKKVDGSYLYIPVDKEEILQKELEKQKEAQRKAIFLKAMQEGNYNYHKDGDKYYLEYKQNGKSSRIVISEAEKSEIDAKVAEEKRIAEEKERAGRYEMAKKDVEKILNTLISIGSKSYKYMGTLLGQSAELTHYAYEDIESKYREYCPIAGYNITEIIPNETNTIFKINFTFEKPGLFKNVKYYDSAVVDFSKAKETITFTYKTSETETAKDVIDSNVDMQKSFVFSNAMTEKAYLKSQKK